MEFLHYPVMNKEIIDVFDHTDKNTFVDCTIGPGGHSYHILKHFEDSKIIAIDVDGESLKKAEANLKGFGDRIRFYQFNFIHLFDRINGLKENVSGILIDPGISTYQLKQKNRGFSHSIDSPLDMRKDSATELTAYEVINSFKGDQLIEIFEMYGEVRNAGELAKKIIERRLFHPIDTTFKLREIVEHVYRWKHRKGKIHPAAKVFQAIRIFVNKELEGIGDFLKKLPDCLKAGARVVHLTYHSIEDRIVKKMFGLLQNQARVKVIKPFPAFPSKSEIAANPPSRSSKLRAVEVL